MDLADVLSIVGALVVLGYSVRSFRKPEPPLGWSHAVSGALIWIVGGAFMGFLLLVFPAYMFGLSLVDAVAFALRFAWVAGKILAFGIGVLFVPYVVVRGLAAMLGRDQG